MRRNSKNIIKVVHLVNYLFAGGAERVVANILENWKNDKYELQAWCLFKGGEIAEELISKGMRVKILNLSQKNRLQVILRLAGLFRKERVRIIHCHHPLTRIWGRLAGILSGVRLIFDHVHGVTGTGNRYIRAKEWFLGLFTTRTIAVSFFVRNFLIEEMGLNPERITVIYNGVDLNVFKPAINNTRKARKFISVCGISRLHPTKGFKYLLEAAPKILERFPNTRFIIVGDGPAKKDLMEYAKSLSIEGSVEFSGTRMDIPAILSAADILVHPSIREGLSLSVIEAHAMGIPVVATSVGGIPEIMSDGLSGILVGFGDADALAKAIVSLIENPDERKRFGENGVRIAQEKFDINDAVQKIEELYENRSV